ncbi:MAG: hypothetical protein PHP45_07005 [Elusimicrobiales bacterium]|nr:hypothetical protein [Elusimicrobiales bacterium]
MKKIMLTAALLSAGAIASALDGGEAQTALPVEPAGVDLRSLFSQTRGGTVLTAQGTALASVYAPVLSLHDSSGTELANLDAGACLRASDARGSPLVSLGLRLDGLLDRFAASGGWVKSHVSAAKLPPVEFGPVVFWYAPEHVWLWGMNISVKFGK